MEENYEGMENLFKNENDNVLMGRENLQVTRCGQNVDDVLAQLRANQIGERYQVTRIVEDVLNRVGFNVGESVICGDKYSSEESDFEVDLAELKKGSPYVCSLLKKISNGDKSSDLKHKSGKMYSFNISKSNLIFDVLLKDK
ncbi:hypothetical protein Ahy_A05g022086 [Arachis hypogaea]|uniref:Uncharacterized protein n=1 Tax=Arachis hypogaea TaxID=3818 RepID=A0A445CZM9_ARAHY|nr:hypothetical protein Ahy_A05g022086 [Arachis hypogaea]